MLLGSPKEILGNFCEFQAISSRSGELWLPLSDLQKLPPIRIRLCTSSSRGEFNQNDSSKRAKYAAKLLQFVLLSLSELPGKWPRETSQKHLPEHTKKSFTIESLGVGGAQHRMFPISKQRRNKFGV